ncbi:MAG TPA: glycoside hydrolase family 15 protein [Thermoleophilaceae bacterium]|nr:glycoside hydrolase family 15 protein [Thermoleophilaceae bacterium]
MLRLRAVLPPSVVVLLALAIPSAAVAVGGTAPGAPGGDATWTPANKVGFGTSTTTGSKVWHTLSDGKLTEVYYPDLGTPSVRDLQFIVSDGKTFAERESDATTQRVELADSRSLTYRQINTAKSGRYRITKTYVTDPARNTLLIDVNFQSLTRKPLDLYALYDPSLTNNGMDDSGKSSGNRLLAYDSTTASALVARPGFTKVSNGYLGTSDGWQDLRNDYKMFWTYTSAPSGNVVQMGKTRVNGRGTRHVTIALGFGGNTSAALAAANGSLGAGFSRVAGNYKSGWHDYLDSLDPMPDSASAFPTEYDVSAMTLAAHEDKTYRGGYIASPTMPWVWGTGLESPSGAYHLVWSRDLYEIATALMADGDRAGAERALTYLFERQQKPDGSFPQNSTVDGTPHWTNTQLDEVAFPIVLAWQLERDDASTWAHVKRAADYIVANGPQTPQERWENQSGWSPATIAAEIAGLVCAADIARANGDDASADQYESTADDWQQNVESWTATTNGPYSSQPYYLRLTKDAQPDNGRTYSIGDGGPSAADQRRIVDPSFLELVRLGVKPADDPTIQNTVKVVDDQLGVTTLNGMFWHRYNYDGYGEMRNGDPWDISDPDTFRTIGRIWPIFAGERGEYELAAGLPGAEGRLASMAGAANQGYMIPEQVWDENPPSGQPGFPRGEGTFSATPLAWSHAQFIRLAWSIDEGAPIEQPSIVADRYGG